MVHFAVLGTVLLSAKASCQGTSSMPAADWEAAAAFTAQSRAVGLGLPGGASWLDWSRAWLPLGQQVRSELERNLADCPEGSLTVLAHSLPALDNAEGDAGSLELVKLLYHLIGDQRLPPGDLKPSDWQREWLLAVASMLRFIYKRWIHVPQDGQLEALQVAPTTTVGPAVPGLQPHHAFLFRQFLHTFKESGVYGFELTENAVLFSEAFAFAAFCHMHEVDLVAESGVYKGASTEIWSLFVQDVVAVDIFITPEAEARLKTRGNIALLTGDGRRLLPQILDQQPDRKIGVFLDGPKGELAIRLALDLRQRKQVAFVALHDMAPYRSELVKLGAFFFSDEGWFQALYGMLDEPFRQRPDLEAGGTMAFLS